MYVHLAKVLDQVEELQYQLEELLDRSPFLIGHVAIVLQWFQLGTLASRLISRVGGFRNGAGVGGEWLSI